jgi:putative glycosyltransferase
MKLSIVTTLFKSENSIAEFDSRIRHFAKEITADFEVIYVDDGSPDDSWSVVKRIAEIEGRTTLISLSRNFGHHRALMRGIAQSSGDFIFLIDSDLEEDPGLLITYWNAMNSDENVHLVEGILNERTGKFIEKYFGLIYWKIIRVMSGKLIDSNLITARLFTSKFRKLLLAHGETEVFIAGLFANVGLKKIRLNVEKGRLSPTSYTLRGRLKLAFIGVTGFSDYPLKLALLLGSMFLTASIVGLLWILVGSLMGSFTVPGWASLIAIMIVMNSIVLFTLGIVSVYISKIFVEIKGRPTSFDDEVISFE